MAKARSSGKWMKGAVKKKGALRATAKRAGLIKGEEKLSSSDLAALKKKGGKTAKRAVLARTFNRYRRG